MRHHDTLEQFLTFVSLTRSAETVQVYKNKLRPMLKEWDAIPITGWNRTLFEKWLASGKAKKWSPRQSQMTLTACRLLIAYYADLAGEGGAPILPNFARGIKAPQVMVVPPVIYTREEVTRLLERMRPVNLLQALAGLSLVFVGERVPHPRSPGARERAPAGAGSERAWGRGGDPQSGVADRVGGPEDGVKRGFDQSGMGSCPSGSLWLFPSMMITSLR